MARYINKDDVLDLVKNLEFEVSVSSNIFDDREYSDSIEIIEADDVYSLDEVDAEEVIRCGSCRFFKPYETKVISREDCFRWIDENIPQDMVSVAWLIDHYERLFSHVSENMGYCPKCGYSSVNATDFCSQGEEKW